MKIRLTFLTENDKQRPPELTEEKVKAVCQTVINAMCLLSDNNDTCVVEKAEFVDDVTLTQSNQKRGEWVKDKDGTTTCTNCGFALEDWVQGVFYNFCPNCGAKMEESE